MLFIFQNLLPKIHKIKNFIVTNNIIYYFFYIFTMYALIFDYRKMDTARVSFGILLFFCIFYKKIRISELFDHITILIICFFCISISSNLVNSIPLTNTLIIVDWLFTYLLAKLFIKFKKISIKNCIYIFSAFIFLFSCVGVISYLFSIQTIAGHEVFTHKRFSFTLQYINRAAFFISISILLLASLLIVRKKTFLYTDILVYYVPIMTMGTALLLTAEKKSFYSLPVFLMFFMIISNKIKLVSFLICIGIAIILIMPFPSRMNLSQITSKSRTVITRTTAWHIATKLISEKPVLGHGFGSFKETSADYFQKNKKKLHIRWYKPLHVPHNINLSALCDTGILGFIVITLIFVTPIKRALRHGTLSILVAGIVFFIYFQMQFGNFFQAPQRTDLTFLIIGFLIALTSLETSSRTDSDSSFLLPNRYLTNPSLKSFYE